MADSNAMLLRVLLLGLLVVAASTPCSAFCADAEQGLVAEHTPDASEQQPPPCHGAPEPQQQGEDCAEGCEDCPPALSATLESPGSFQRAHLLSAPAPCSLVARMAESSRALRPAIASDIHAPPARRTLHLKSSLLI